MGATLSIADLEAADPRHVRKSGETDCLCPLCGGDKRADGLHRSLSYNGQTGKWKCHRCGEHGLLTDFQTKQQAPDYTFGSRRERARRDLASRFQGAPLNTPRNNPATAPDAPAPDAAEESERSSRWTQLMQALCPLADTQAADYLAGRSLPVELCHRAGVRFSPDWFGVPAAVFPLRDAAGNLMAAQGRAIAATGSKPNKRTFNRRESGMGVFATPGAWESQTLVIVEAPIDALSLAIAGVPALALCGKEIGAARSAWFLPRCFGRHVLLAFDADIAGDAAAVKIAGELRTVGVLSVKRLTPHGAKDWNDILRRHGVAALCGELTGIMSDRAADEGTQSARADQEYDEPLPEDLQSLGRALEAELCERAERLAAIAAQEAATASQDDDAYGDRIRSGYLAARSGLMPEGTCVVLASNGGKRLPADVAPGVTTDQPAKVFLRIVDQLRGIRATLPHSEYMATTAGERATLDAIAEWWESIAAT